MAALAVGRLVEQATGWSINRFVKALRLCCAITVQAGDQTVTAADPIPTTPSRPSPNSAGTLRTKLAKVRVLLKRRLGLGDGRLVLGDRAPEALQCDQLRLWATALAGVESVDRREFLGGEFEVEHVDVLGDPLRLGRLRDH